jgi:hypothetical protein
MAVPIPVPTERKGSDPKARRDFEAELKAKQALSDKYKAIWSALNLFIARNGGYLISPPHAKRLLIEVPQYSELPDKLADLGYDLQPTGSNTRIEGGQFVPVGENFNVHIPKPVKVAAIKLADLDIELEAKEAAAKVAERRVIRAGRDAWHEIGRAESFEAWCRIGAALAVGKAYALKATGANAAWGRNYSLAFSAWMKECGFGFMRPSDRSMNQ